MAKIDIISGFLGAGKTTLIKKLLAEAYKGEKVVLIENEFGEISIDGGFLKDSGIQISEMSSGCICCSLVGDFSQALKDVAAKFNPDRIIIEPSGVGKLSDVIRAVDRVADEDENIVLNSFITVADATKTKVYMKNFGEFFNDQVEHAGCVILSRTGNIAEEKLSTAIELIKGVNHEATIITTPWEQLDGKQILSAMEKTSADFIGELLEELEEHHHHDDDDDDGCCCHHHDHEHEHECCCHHDHDHHHHHHDGKHDADEVFTSWGEESAKKFSMDEIESILKELDTEKYGKIVRSKGIVPTTDGKWIHFDYVPEEHDIRYGSSDVTGRFVVIGENIDEEKLEKLFGVH